MANIRIYFDGKLTVGAMFNLPTDTARYLVSVMRLERGNQFRVFGNGEEFIAELVDKNSARVIMLENAIETANSAVLAFCPIKPARLEEMINMATQMGVRAFQPVISEFTNQPKMNLQRFHKIAVEAAEQCGRLSVPEILPAVKFDEFVRGAQNLYYGDERVAHNDLGVNAILPSRNDEGEFVFLVGPEGGFSAREFEALEKSGAEGIGLGRTILRAETAAVVGLALLIN
jgi:16S rRNA (uracil1498-N3)-methyltransferase